MASDSEKQITLVRLALRGEREELIDHFLRQMTEAESRVLTAGAHNPADPEGYGRVQEAIASTYRRAANFIRERVNDDKP